MCPTRNRSFEWGRIFGSYRNSSEDVVRQEDPKTEKQVEPYSFSVRKAIGEKYPHIVRLKTRLDLLHDNLWLDFSREIDWSHEYCKGLVHVRIFLHEPEVNGDWPILHTKTSNTRNSMFFAFSDEDESLIFSIKFKR